MPVLEVASFAPVYTIRTHEDLEYVRAKTQPRSLDPMGKYLVGCGVITSADLDEALAIQRHSVDRRLGWILCKLGHLDEVALGRLLAAHVGVACVSLVSYRASGDYSRRLPDLIARDNGAALLHEDELHGWLAVPDVTNKRVVRDATAWLRKAVSPVMASREDIARFVRGDAPEAIDPRRLRFDSPEERRRYLEQAGLPSDSPEFFRIEE